MSTPPRMPVRRPVAVLLSRFPLVTETFILREAMELERQGQPVRLVPLLREDPEVIHREAKPWMERALFTPFVSGAILGANLRRFARRPVRYLATLLRLLFGTLPSPGFWAKSLALFPKAVYLAERLEREDVAHLHAHYATHPATVAWIAARVSSLTYSFTVHAHDVFVDRTFLAPKLKEARWVRAISRFNRDFLAERYPEAAEKIEVVHVGVDPESYTAPTPSSREGPPLLLCIAGLKPYKGIPVLLAALDELRRRGVEFRCALLGDGPLRDEVAAEIERRGLESHVEMLGARPQDEVARWIGRASVLVCPSVVAPDGQMEGIPVVLMEAGAAAKPVAAAALSGIPELVVDRETGELFPPGDAPSLADVVERFLRRPDYAARLGEALRRRVWEDFHLRYTTQILLARLDDYNEPPQAKTRHLAEVAAEMLDDVQAVGVRSMVRGPDAEVADLLILRKGGSDRFVLKHHLSRPGESAPPEERAWREAEVLRGLEDRTTQDVSVPRVLGAAPREAALLLSPAEGTPLDELFRRLRRERGARAGMRLGELGRRAGEWLRWLQGSFPVDETDPRASLLVRGRRAISSAVERGELSPTEAETALGRLKDWAASVEPRTVARHGDFWPGNLRVSEDGRDRVEVLDFEGFGPGLPEEDPAALLVHSALYFPPPWEELGRRFEAGVLAGWGGGRETHSHRLAFCRAEAAARALAAGAAASDALLVGRALVRWRRRRLLRDLLGGEA